MGLFWDLIQQSQIEEQNTKAASIEQRVVFLEEELKKTRELLQKTLTILEAQVGKDIDGDGRIG
mgnify:CR=1 FL=1